MCTDVTEGHLSAFGRAGIKAASVAVRPGAHQSGRGGGIAGA